MVSPVSVFLSLGSNQGWRENNLRLATSALAAIPCCQIVSQSSVYEENFIGSEGPAILTKVLKIRTAILPHTLLGFIQKIEDDIGRQRQKRWAPRLIDIDILDYRGWIYADERLILPHPRFDKRPGTIKALLEIQPHWIHPLKGRTCNINEIDFKGRIFEEEIS
ncbi:2-amino-4-hydroxy-6-hydroxymethyldihydropteridine diphosphokinase [candidate division WOR-3 bacterium]|nr:2-amino-4-hydroxy-6-hydroxymethyldihydropteridine diphosphokinase [candidate division WOR-3 bacterium]